MAIQAPTFLFFFSLGFSDLGDVMGDIAQSLFIRVCIKVYMHHSNFTITYLLLICSILAELRKTT